MNNSKEYFDANGYVVLQDAMTEENCNLLVQRMFKLYEEGKLVKDTQCPLSDSIYGDSEFEKILENFAKPIGNAIGKNLIPTYTYARIYRPGEILKKHIDRPSCEISATLTLGYDSKNVWPIFFDDDKEIPVFLDVGELAVYKGCEVVHWRPPFKGNWHVQVFLHYVDANGPYKNFAFDERNSLGTNSEIITEKSPEVVDAKKENFIDSFMEKAEETSKKVSLSQLNFNFQRPNFDAVVFPNNSNFFPGYFCIDKDFLPELMFTKEECRRIIDLTNSYYPATARIGGAVETTKIEKDVRSANIYLINNNLENKWIYEKISNAVIVANKIHFNFEILGIIHEIQLIEYSADSKVPGHYDWHIDTGSGTACNRKISFTAQLSDPNDYDECDLIINNYGSTIVGTKEQGSIHMFPSFVLHKVSPIKRGTRYALVIWVHGSERFR